MTDDEILDQIDRRFAGVETRMPPRRVELASTLGHVAIDPGSRFRSGPLSALVLLVVIAVSLAVGSRLTSGAGAEASQGPSDFAGVPAPNGSSTPVPSASSSPSVVPSVGPTAAASPAARDLEIIRDSTFDGEHVISMRMGWGPCLMSGDALMVFPSGRDLDAAIDRAGTTEGFVAIDRSGSFWVGPTAESAARGYGSPILVIDRRSIAWIVQPGDAAHPGSVGRELRQVPTPKGRIAWFPGNSVQSARCTDG